MFEILRLLCPSSKYGGIQQKFKTSLGRIYEILSLSTQGAPKTQELDGYRLHRARLDLQIASTSMSLAVIPQFSRLASQADLIHYHFPWPFMDLVHFLTRVRKPTVVTYHSDIIRQKFLLKLYRPLMDRFLDDVSCIVATSPNYLATSDVLCTLQHKVRIIPIGLDRGSYAAPSPDKLARWRQQLGPKFFLFVGVLRYYKGLHILIEAARGTGYPVVIVGAGPIEEELKVQAARLQLDNIHFLGHLPEDDKTALLSLCLAVVFPSHQRSEAFGISLLEGAMFGKPMVSSEIGTGTTFINIADETGLVVPPSDPQALRQAMRWLWDHPLEASAMGRRAEARYWKHFTADQMVKSYVGLYRELLTRPAQ
jgi:rhamnosyl/mannosyltransferase